jgi:hypothetical protein
MNWIITQGNADISKNVIKYVPEKFTNEMGQENFLSTIIGSDKDFESGEIEFTIKTEDNKSICQIVFNYDSGLPLVTAGLNTNGFLYGIIKLVGTKWENLSVTGIQNTFETGKEYNIKIKIEGSIIELYVNGVKVCSAFERIRKSQLRLLLQGSKPIEIKNFKVSEQNPKAFVIMQFSDEYNQLYEEVIRPVTEEFGILCVRADEYHTTNPIIEDIINSITEASVVIADITPDNPNVFYEVGYSHALGKPTILLCDKKRVRLPFDVSSFRTLFYDNTIAGKTQVEKRLRKFLDNIF